MAIDFRLTEEQKDWFGERISESRTGRVIVPSYLCDKYRKLSDRPDLSNEAVKSILIDECY